MFALALVAHQQQAAGGGAVVVSVPGIAGAPDMVVTADVGSSSAFRLGVEFSGDNAAVAASAALPSPSLDAARAMANATRVSGPDGVGLLTSFGELLVAADGRFTLRDAGGHLVARAIGPPALAAEATGHDGITMPVSGSKSGPGANGRRPCLVNGGWGPNFHWDQEDNFFAFAVSEHAHDPDYIHCYPVSFDGVNGDFGAPASNQDTCTVITHVVPYGWGAGGGGNYSVELPHSPVKQDGHSSCCAACNDEPACAAWVQDNSAAAKGKANCHLFSCVDQWVPLDLLGEADHDFLAGGYEGQCPAPHSPTTPPVPPPATQPTGGYIHQDGWFGLGRHVDWYLAPTPAGGFDFTRALFDLTGAPAVPPLFGMAFMATYWGYTSMGQVESYMHEFRRRRLPIDSFIMDYDWFGPDPCPANGSTTRSGDGPDAVDAGADAPPAPPPQGGCNCGDFGYRRGWWNNVSFAQPDGTVARCDAPADVFAHFASPPLSLHFGAIRKPRTYSNKALCEANGWLLPNASDVGEGGDINFNFSAPGMARWYTDAHAHFIEDGMDFWWNDEGETSWFTYLLWNEAQAAMFGTGKPNTRHFTINRAWQPGMQRFPAISWTGDGQSCTHQELLRGMMNGCPLTSCDLTSPDAVTLVRQYQSAVFTPIMRVHEMQGTPRFPWFWPDPNATAPAVYEEVQDAFRAAIGMRYTFLPFLYSLAHAAHTHGRPIGHPASFAFPAACAADPAGKASRACAAARGTYTVGGALIPSDLGALVHTNAKGLPRENASSATLPVDCRWFRWNTTAAFAGGQTVRSSQLQLAEMAVFVKAGAILPLQANGSSVQFSAQAGGALELHVYAGADGSFEMVEDDGISLDYRDAATAAAKEGAMRTTTWRWSDATKTLTWAVGKGGAALRSPNLYTAVLPLLFEEGVAGPQRAAQQPLAASGGKIVFN
jgi:alpha-glucosidase